jgi:hypothetical protein
MPEVLDTMPKVSRSGRKPLYNYDDLFSHGEKPVKLVQGEDFTCSTRTMRHNLYRQSKTRNLDIKTVTLDDDEAIVFQILPEGSRDKTTPAKKITSKLTAKTKK